MMHGGTNVRTEDGSKQQIRVGTKPITWPYLVLLSIVFVVASLGGPRVRPAINSPGIKNTIVAALAPR